MQQTSKDSLAQLTNLVITAAFMYPVVNIFINQLSIYLTDGVWNSYSVIRLFSNLDLGESLNQWVLFGGSWIGVWKILDWLHASVILVVAGGIALGIAMIIEGKLGAESF